MQIRRPPQEGHVILLRANHSQWLTTYTFVQQNSTFNGTTYPSQNAVDDFWNNAGEHLILFGNGEDSGDSFDGYIAEYVFIDGTQYASTDFGEMSNGVWIAKDPSGLTFGNNGCYLKMAAGAIGTDSSGNGNNFTVSNIEPHDVVLDSPTLNSDSNGGNFATWNPLNAGSYTTLAEGNLKATGTGSGASNPSGTFAMTSGKWYFEVYLDGSPAGGWPGIGIIRVEAGAINNITVGQQVGNHQNQNYTSTVFATHGNKNVFGQTSTASYGTAFSSTDIYNIAVDIDGGKIWWGKNNTYFNSGEFMIIWN